MRTAAGIIVFNDRRSLYRTLSTLADFNYVFVIDGRFPDYDHTSDLSDDGTRDIVEQFDNTILIDCPADEVTKRNRYLEACRQYNIDYLLIIDSDEWILESDWVKFLHNLEDFTDDSANIYGIRSYYNYLQNRDTAVYPRLWRRPGDMEYFKCHNVFRHIPTGNIIHNPSNLKVIEGIKLAWDDTLRNPEYLKASSNYQAKLVEKESPIRHGLAN